jgi:hypothetical protein
MLERTKKALARIRRVFYRPPDFYIGGWENPYIRRWWVIPRNKYFNIYLHNQLRDDDDRALHDHPWFNISIIIRGGYIEHRPVAPHLYPYYDKRVVKMRRKAPCIIFRRAQLAHRLELINEVPSTDWTKVDPRATSQPIHRPQSWSIFITGRRWREWGFWCPGGYKGWRWVHWEKFTDPKDTGKTGKGCDA